MRETDPVFDTSLSNMPPYPYWSGDPRRLDDRDPTPRFAGMYGSAQRLPILKMHHGFLRA